MNWRVNPLGPIATLSALLALASCQAPITLESPVGPDTEQIGVNYVELSLPTQLVRIDSINTTNHGSLMVGHYRDLELGTVEATGYLRFSLATPDPVVKQDSRVDSLVVRWEPNFIIANEDYIPNQTFSAYLLSLNDTIRNGVNYYSTSSMDKGDLLGTHSFSIDRTVEDTVYHLRLDNTWGEELLAKMKQRDPAFKNTGEFLARYPGIVFESDPTNEVVMGINYRNDANTSVRLYFSSPGDTVSKSYDLAIAGSSVAGFHQLSAWGDGIASSAITDFYDPVDGNGRVLAMAGAGYATLLDLDVVRTYFETLPPNLINYADLYVGNVEEWEKNNLPASMQFLLTEDDGQFISIFGISSDSVAPNTPGNPAKGIYAADAIQEPEALGEVAYFYPYRMDSTDYYSGPITPFMQLLADSAIMEPKLLVLPVSMGSNFKTLKLDENDLKLRIYYTTPTN